MSLHDIVRNERGEFLRPQAAFREPVQGDPERFHLYVSPACPWSHRAIIMRELGGLADRLGMSWVAPYRDERGWRFTGGAYSDPVNGFEYLAEAYTRTDPGYDGRISVPVLWDKEAGIIAANESEDLVVLFDRWGDAGLYPPELREQIDHVNDRVYACLNNGVYRAGFARSQEAYENAFDEVFATLTWLDERLGESRYLVGDEPTIADWRLFPTLVRFDAVYHLHFRCNGRRLIDYPNLWPYARDLFQHPGIAPTVEWEQIKEHYYTTHPELNPKRIIPKGPLGIDWNEPSGR